MEGEFSYSFPIKIDLALGKSIFMRIGKICINPLLGAYAILCEYNIGRYYVTMFFRKKAEVKL